MQATLVSASAMLALAALLSGPSAAAQTASPVGTWVITGSLPERVDSARLEIVGPPEDRWGRITFIGAESRTLPLAGVLAVRGAFAAVLRLPSGEDTLYFGAANGAGELATFDRRTPLRVARRASAPSAELAALAGVERVAPGVISTGRGDGFGTFTPDGREFYHGRHTANWSRHTIVVSRLVDGRWSEPQVAPFSGTFSDREPFVTADGRRLFFGSNRPHPEKTDRASYDVWMVERGEDGSWGAPQRLPAPVSTEHSGLHPV
ncbi:MAG TPA: hypothetical protein VEW03_13715, partial [Longimicrobiaceae bacterium]|nr:hypothetical protein [Longimicrobiaceae bacterium]